MCMYIHISYPVICQWAFRSPPCLHHREQCCNEHGDEISSKTMALCVCSEMSIGSCGSYVFDVLKKLHTVFHKGCRIHIQQCTGTLFSFPYTFVFTPPSTDMRHYLKWL